MLKDEMSAKKSSERDIFDSRIAPRLDELKWLYIELYENDWMFAELLGKMEIFYSDRPDELKRLDAERVSDPGRYKRNDMTGYMLYTDNFAKNLKGVKRRLSYREEAGVKMIHLLPFFDTVKGESDGGYSVRDFKAVRRDLGDMEDLKELTEACHKRDMLVCCDVVMNHTSDKHEWAVRAAQGEKEYMDRYYFYDDQDAVRQYDEIVPQVFPVSAPGNFTYLADLNKYVMTTFHPYQWDLNYHDPHVFNEMVYNLLYLANCGVDIMRLDAVPYIWKELGTSCRNLWQVHSIVRMIRLITETVCPGVYLLGEVVMEPEKVVPYFGSVEKPECHMLYNVTTMATIWNSVATRDVRLLKAQFNKMSELPKEYIFLNYIRCHDDIGWGLDYGLLSGLGMEEIAHKRYLNDFFLGNAGYSNSRGEIYNDDPNSMDARMCGTTASLCGLEKAEEDGDKYLLDKSIDLDVMLHAYMFMQSGIPVIYSGDEIGQTNDYSYKNDPEKKDDSRYVHRGTFRWDLEKKRKLAKSAQARIFNSIASIEKIRAKHEAFSAAAATGLINVYDDSVICIERTLGDDRVLGIFNFSEHEKEVMPGQEGAFRDLMTGELTPFKHATLKGYGFLLLSQCSNR